MPEALESAFKILYERPPEPGEVATLVAMGVMGAPTEQQLMRRILAATDRQALGSPFTIRFAERDIQYVELEGFELALDTADVAVSNDMIVRSTYETHLTAFMKDHVQPGMTVVDVGANVGYFSMLCSAIVGEEGRVLAFEPNTENARLFLLSVFKNKTSNIELHPIALAPHRGKAVFTPHQGSNGGLITSDLEQAVMNPNCQIVPTARLDDMVEGRVDFIKLDVEGAEGLVMAGAQRILENYRPIVTSEYSPEMLGRISGVGPADYLRQFTRLGYTVQVLGRSGEAAPVEDIEAFVATYGAHTRIEDLAFLPPESTG